MSEASAIDTATRRLISALDALEAAVDRRREADHGTDALTVQIQAFGNDRSKLAAELDAVTARARELETVNREVAERINGAIAQIRTALDEGSDAD